MENFYSGEKRSLLIKLNIDPGIKKEVLLGTFNINYFDVLGNSSKSIKKNISIKTTKNKELVKISSNKKIEAEALLIEADKKHEEYLKMYEKENKKTALKNIMEPVNWTLKKSKFTGSIINFTRFYFNKCICYTTLIKYYI